MVMVPLGWMALKMVFASACIKFLLLPTFAAVLVRFAESPLSYRRHFVFLIPYVQD